MMGRPGIMIMCINDGKIFESVSAAANFYNIDHGAISNQINGKRKSVAGKIFYKIPPDMTFSQLQIIRQQQLHDVLGIA